MNEPDPPRAGRPGPPPGQPRRRNPAPQEPLPRNPAPQHAAQRQAPQQQPPQRRAPQHQAPQQQAPQQQARRFTQPPQAGAPANPPAQQARPPRRPAPAETYQPLRAYSAAAEPREPTRYAPRQEPDPIPAPRRSTASDRPRRTEEPAAGRRSAERTPAPAVGAGQAAPATRRKRPRRGRLTGKRIGSLLLIVLLVAVITPVAMMFYYDSKLHRVDALPSYAGRPADTPGTTWLIVGTDSRADLTAAQKRDLATGDSDGARTDTIMLVYKPPSGDASIISIPRDLFVPVPGQGQHKINAAFSLGGPTLLVQTVEQLSGVRIDHYAEIGFGGFDRLVDAVGGVEMCIDSPMRDPKAGLNIKAGCQTLNGKQALGFVRTRAFANADLERVRNQRKFLSALMAKATSPTVLLNPFTLIPFLNGAVDTLTVDQSTHVWNLAMLAWWLRSSPQTVTTPNGGPVDTIDGSSLAVGDNTTEFFDAIRRGQQIPTDLVDSTGTG